MVCRALAPRHQQPNSAHHSVEISAVRIGLGGHSVKKRGAKKNKKKKTKDGVSHITWQTDDLMFSFHCMHPSMTSFLGRIVRLRTRNPPIRHIQRVLNSTRRPASTIPLFFRRMPGQGRKSKSTTSEPYYTPNDAKLDDLGRDREREAAENSPEFQALMHETELAAPFFLFRPTSPRRANSSTQQGRSIVGRQARQQR